MLINIKCQDKFKGNLKRKTSNRPPPPLELKNDENNEITDDNRTENDIFLVQKSKSRSRPAAAGAGTSPKYFDAEKFKSISERLKQIYHHTFNDTVNDRSVNAIRVDRSVEWPAEKSLFEELEIGLVTETLDEMATEVVDGTEVIDFEKTADILDENMVEKGTEIIDDTMSNETEGGIEETPEEIAEETLEDKIEEFPEDIVQESGTEVIDEQVEKSTESIDEDETKENQGTEVMDEDNKATEEVDESETKDCRKDNSCRPKPPDCENETEGCKEEDEEDDDGEDDGKEPGFRDLAVARYSHWKLIIGK